MFADQRCCRLVLARIMQPAMDETTYNLTVDKPYEQALDWLAGQVRAAGLQVMQTFDLQAARSAHTACSCPHHGTQACDCQMVVLLIYAADCPPASLLAHSSAGQTHFELVDTPQQHADPRLAAALLEALAGDAGD